LFFATVAFAATFFGAAVCAASGKTTAAKRIKNRCFT
jgi:hypothetical protein